MRTYTVKSDCPAPFSVANHNTADGPCDERTTCSATTFTKEPAVGLAFSMKGDGTGPRVLSFANELSAVLCCKGTQVDSSAFVRMEDTYGCNSGKTYEEARAICAASPLGLNLCTEAQILAGVKATAGCSFDHQAVWIDGGEAASTEKYCIDKEDRAGACPERAEDGADFAGEGRKMCRVAGLHLCTGAQLMQLWLSGDATEKASFPSTVPVGAYIVEPEPALCTPEEDQVFNFTNKTANEWTFDCKPKTTCQTPAEEAFAWKFRCCQTRKDSFAHGEECTIKCKSGYTASVTKTACSSTLPSQNLSVWTPQPYCSANPCKFPENVENVEPAGPCANIPFSEGEIKDSMGCVPACGKMPAESERDMLPNHGLLMCAAEVLTPPTFECLLPAPRPENIYAQLVGVVSIRMNWIPGSTPSPSCVHNGYDVQTQVQPKGQTGFGAWEFRSECGACSGTCDRSNTGCSPGSFPEGASVNYRVREKCANESFTSSWVRCAVQADLRSVETPTALLMTPQGKLYSDPGQVLVAASSPVAVSTPKYANIQECLVSDSPRFEKGECNSFMYPETRGRLCKDTVCCKDGNSLDWQPSGDCACILKCKELFPDDCAPGTVLSPNKDFCVDAAETVPACVSWPGPGTAPGGWKEAHEACRARTMELCTVEEYTHVYTQTTPGLQKVKSASWSAYARDYVGCDAGKHKTMIGQDGTVGGCLADTTCMSTGFYRCCTTVVSTSSIGIFHRWGQDPAWCPTMTYKKPYNEWIEGSPTANGEAGVISNRILSWKMPTGFGAFGCWYKVQLNTGTVQTKPFEEEPSGQIVRKNSPTWAFEFHMEDEMPVMESITFDQEVKKDGVKVTINVLFHLPCEMNCRLVDARSKCDWKCYLDRYPDLRTAGWTESNAFTHWNTTGQVAGLNCFCDGLMPTMISPRAIQPATSPIKVVVEAVRPSTFWMVDCYGHKFGKPHVPMVPHNPSDLAVISDPEDGIKLGVVEQFAVCDDGSVKPTLPPKTMGGAEVNDGMAILATAWPFQCENGASTPSGGRGKVMSFLIKFSFTLESIFAQLRLDGYANGVTSGEVTRTYFLDEGIQKESYVNMSVCSDEDMFKGYPCKPYSMKISIMDFYIRINLVRRRLSPTSEEEFFGTPSEEQNDQSRKLLSGRSASDVRRLQGKGSGKGSGTGKGSAGTDAPTEAPTEAPTVAPTPPTEAPTEGPPTEAPTETPTFAPSKAPTAPTTEPTSSPTFAPVVGPTSVPTLTPTPAPTSAPTPRPDSVQAGGSYGYGVDCSLGNAFNYSEFEVYLGSRASGFKQSFKITVSAGVVEFEITMTGIGWNLPVIIFWSSVEISTGTYVSFKPPVVDFAAMNGELTVGNTHELEVTFRENPPPQLVTAVPPSFWLRILVTKKGSSIDNMCSETILIGGNWSRPKCTIGKYAHDNLTFAFQVRDFYTRDWYDINVHDALFKYKELGMTDFHILDSKGNPMTGGVNLYEFTQAQRIASLCKAYIVVDSLPQITDLLLVDSALSEYKLMLQADQGTFTRDVELCTTISWLSATRMECYFRECLDGRFLTATPDIVLQIGDIRSRRQAKKINLPVPSQPQDEKTLGVAPDVVPDVGNNLFTLTGKYFPTPIAPETDIEEACRAWKIDIPVDRRPAIQLFARVECQVGFATCVVSQMDFEEFQCLTIDAIRYQRKPLEKDQVYGEIIRSEDAEIQMKVGKYIIVEKGILPPVTVPLLQCDPGERRVQENLGVCEKCPAGQISSAVTEQFPLQCTYCDPGRYNPTPGSTACLDCPANTWTDGVGTDITSCVCMRGYYSPYLLTEDSTSALPGMPCEPCHNDAMTAGPPFQIECSRTDPDDSCKDGQPCKLPVVEMCDEPTKPVCILERETYKYKVCSFFCRGGVSLPVTKPWWFFDKWELDADAGRRLVAPAAGAPGRYKALIALCEPKEACGADNLCATGYCGKACKECCHWKHSVPMPFYYPLQAPDVGCERCSDDQTLSLMITIIGGTVALFAAFFGSLLVMKFKADPIFKASVIGIGKAQAKRFKFIGEHIKRYTEPMGFVERRVVFTSIDVGKTWMWVSERDLGLVYRIDADKHRVIIAGVEKGSPAAEKDIHPGWWLTTLNGKSLKCFNEVTVLKRLKAVRLPIRMTFKAPKGSKPQEDSGDEGEEKDANDAAEAGGLMTRVLTMATQVLQNFQNVLSMPSLSYPPLLSEVQRILSSYMPWNLINFGGVPTECSEAQVVWEEKWIAQLIVPYVAPLPFTVSLILQQVFIKVHYRKLPEFVSTMDWLLLNAWARILNTIFIAMVPMHFQQLITPIACETEASGRRHIAGALEIECVFTDERYVKAMMVCVIGIAAATGVLSAYMLLVRRSYRWQFQPRERKRIPVAIAMVEQSVEKTNGYIPSVRDRVTVNITSVKLFNDGKEGEQARALMEHFGVEVGAVVPSSKDVLEEAMDAKEKWTNKLLWPEFAEGMVLTYGWVVFVNTMAMNFATMFINAFVAPESSSVAMLLQALVYILNGLAGTLLKPYAVDLLNWQEPLLYLLLGVLCYLVTFGGLLQTQVGKDKYEVYITNFQYITNFMCVCIILVILGCIGYNVLFVLKAVTGGPGTDLNKMAYQRHKVLKKRKMKEKTNESLRAVQETVDADKPLDEKKLDDGTSEYHAECEKLLMKMDRRHRTQAARYLEEAGSKVYGSREALSQEVMPAAAAGSAGDRRKIERKLANSWLYGGRLQHPFDIRREDFETFAFEEMIQTDDGEDMITAYLQFEPVGRFGDDDDGDMDDLITGKNGVLYSGRIERSNVEIGAMRFEVHTTPCLNGKGAGSTIYATVCKTFKADALLTMSSSKLKRAREYEWTPDFSDCVPEIAYIEEDAEQVLGKLMKMLNLLPGTYCYGATGPEAKAGATAEDIAGVWKSLMRSPCKFTIGAKDDGELFFEELIPRAHLPKPQKKKKKRKKKKPKRVSFREEELEEMDEEAQHQHRKEDEEPHSGSESSGEPGTTDSDEELEDNEMAKRHSSEVPEIVDIDPDDLLEDENQFVTLRGMLDPDDIFARDGPHMLGILYADSSSVPIAVVKLCMDFERDQVNARVKMVPRDAESSWESLPVVVGERLDLTVGQKVAPYVGARVYVFDAGENKLHFPEGTIASVPAKTGRVQVRHDDENGTVRAWSVGKDGKFQLKIMDDDTEAMLKNVRLEEAYAQLHALCGHWMHHDRGGAVEIEITVCPKYPGELIYRDGSLEAFLRPDGKQPMGTPWVFIGKLTVVQASAGTGWIRSLPQDTVALLEIRRDFAAGTMLKRLGTAKKEGGRSPGAEWLVCSRTMVEEEPPTLTLAEVLPGVNAHLEVQRESRYGQRWLCQASGAFIYDEDGHWVFLSYRTWRTLVPHYGAQPDQMLPSHWSSDGSVPYECATSLFKSKEPRIVFRRPGLQFNTADEVSPASEVPPRAPKPRSNEAKPKAKAIMPPPAPKLPVEAISLTDNSASGSGSSTEVNKTTRQKSPAKSTKTAAARAASSSKDPPPPPPPAATSKDAAAPPPPPEKRARAASSSKDPPPPPPPAAASKDAAAPPPPPPVQISITPAPEVQAEPQRLANDVPRETNEAEGTQTDNAKPKKKKKKDLTDASDGLAKGTEERKSQDLMSLSEAVAKPQQDSPIRLSQNVMPKTDKSNRDLLSLQPAPAQAEAVIGTPRSSKKKSMPEDAPTSPLLGNQAVSDKSEKRKKKALSDEQVPDNAIAANDAPARRKKKALGEPLEEQQNRSSTSSKHRAPSATGSDAPARRKKEPLEEQQNRSSTSSKHRAPSATGSDAPARRKKKALD
eukprot:TRINITY_DN20533_c0_g3_i1.p1 TRINITY_DN20533_c0_g3~~TRINITY_DN20533_c0_g3_i1.p1  ORF type:complete len:3798 (+),score=761.53 TRINITY_DN20533_c0_g3_i1:354-11747(+)